MTEGVPAPLDARPSVRAAWLQWCNFWRRWPLGAAALVCAFLALGALGRIRLVAYGLTLAARSPRLVVAVTTVLAASFALRHRRRLENGWHHHWLAAVPRDLSRATRTAAGPVAAWVAGAVLVTSLSLVAGLPSWVPLRLLGYGACGVVVGAALAAVIGALGTGGGTGRAVRALPRSRFTAARRERHDRASRVSLFPLGHWPLAEAHFRDRPVIRARSLLLLLLMVPMGTTGGAALAAAVAWLLGLHLINLLLALVRSAFSASWWLAPTPLGPVRFTAALAYRMFGAQIAASAALIAIAYVTLGPAPLRIVGGVAGIWLGAVGVIGATVCVAAFRNRSIAASALHRWRQ